MFQATSNQDGIGNNVIFRLSPRLTWHRALGRAPYQSHYKIEETPNSSPKLSGSATLQIFPPIDVMESKHVPLIMHSHVYPLAKGGQFASFDSKVFWFEAQMSSMVASSNYVDNRSLASIHTSTDPWDWIVSSPVALALPTQPITVNFSSEEAAYSSAWNPASRAQARLGLGIGQGTAYTLGDQYTLPNEELQRRVQIRTGRGPGLVGYAFTTQCAKLSMDTEEVVFWINTGQYTIDQIDIDLARVEVTENRDHLWVRQETRWTRIN
jgi:hypothetical protein